MKRILFVIVIASLCFADKAWCQDFDDYFTDNTLRIDYNFAGNNVEQHIALDELCTSPGWYGKRKRLADVPMEGNGQITVRAKDGTMIYRNSFSTLFQEWINYDEAKTTSKSFENVFLVPMPKDTVVVSVELYNSRRERIASFTHRVVPTDILIRHIGEKRKTPYETVMKAADADNCINIAYVAEGYTAKEMGKFLSDVRKANDAMFAHEPFASEKSKFNVVAVKPVSEDSGTSDPCKGVWKNTPLNSHFDTFYSNRYLTTLSLKRLHDVLAGIPYEHIIILVNTAEYGGGGILNSYNLSMTDHKMFKPVVVHEFGHSFAGLADEYAYEYEQLGMYPLDVEPWEQNITTLNDFNSKWKDMLDDNTPLPTPESFTPANGVGVYEKAGYSLKGVYRPAKDCRMRTNTNPDFCPVCRRAIKRVIDFYTE